MNVKGKHRRALPHSSEVVLPPASAHRATRLAVRRAKWSCQTLCLEAEESPASLLWPS